jgi:murein DD-endopeptidase MepM/ murein hydrolase activator NlpD
MPRKPLALLVLNFRLREPKRHLFAAFHCAISRTALSLAFLMSLAACGQQGDRSDWSNAPQSLYPVSSSANELAQRAALPSPGSPFGGIAPAEAVEQLLNFAEPSYPLLFPTHQPTLAYEKFLYRFYPTSGIYLGVAVNVGSDSGLTEGGVYVMGGEFGNAPTFVGLLVNYVTPSLSPTSAVVGQAGGTVATAGGGVRLDLTANALTGPTTLSIEPAVSAPFGNLLNAIEIGPTGTSFAAPATLSLAYAASLVPPEWTQSSLTLAVASGSDWIDLPSFVNTDTKVVSAPLTHLSTYAIKVADPTQVSTPNGMTWSPSDPNNASHCWSSNDPAYNAQLAHLGQLLFKLQVPPRVGTGCVTEPYAADGYSFYWPTLENHAGIDFRARTPQPVFALVNGTVENVSFNVPEERSTLTIRSRVAGTDYHLLYLHCQSLTLIRDGTSLGQPVVGTTILKGDQVCVSGSVGAPAAHLHFEVKRVGMDSDNLSALSGGHCQGLSFSGWNSGTRTFDKPTSPGCPLAFVIGNTVDPTVLVPERTYLPEPSADGVPVVLPRTASRITAGGVFEMVCHATGGCNHGAAIQPFAGGTMSSVLLSNGLTEVTANAPGGARLSAQYDPAFGLARDFMGCTYDRWLQMPSSIPLNLPADSVQKAVIQRSCDDGGSSQEKWVGRKLHAASGNNKTTTWVYDAFDASSAHVYQIAFSVTVDTSLSKVLGMLFFDLYDYRKKTVTYFSVTPD